MIVIGLFLEESKSSKNRIAWQQTPAFEDTRMKLENNQSLHKSQQLRSVQRAKLWSFHGPFLCGATSSNVLWHVYIFGSNQSKKDCQLKLNVVRRKSVCRHSPWTPLETKCTAMVRTKLALQHFHNGYKTYSSLVVPFTSAFCSELLLSLGQCSLRLMKPMKSKS